jgi:hypothetical protein
VVSLSPGIIAGGSAAAALMIAALVVIILCWRWSSLCPRQEEDYRLTTTMRMISDDEGSAFDSDLDHTF